jgi:hypothetical protein
MFKRFAPIAFLTAALMFAPTTASQASPTGDALLKMPAPASQMSAEQWESFSGNLVAALATRHEGLQMGAMRLALQYADNVDVRGGLVDIMRIYRNHEDENVRRLAVVTLGSTKSTLAVNYLRLNEAFEDSETIRKTIRAVLAQVDSAN